MTIKEAILHSKKTGAKITHRYFLSDEYIIVNDNNIVIDENGMGMSLQEFLYIHNNPVFNFDWDIFNN